MIKIAICDDMTEITSQLENIIIEISKKHLVDVDIGVFFSGDDLLRYINNGNTFDLIFLDIEMEIIDGIEVGNEIRESMSDNDTQIVYISGKADYAMALFRIRPFNFLVKPLESEKVEDVFLTYLKANDKNQYFPYKKGGAHNRIEVKDIIFFESNNRKVNIVTKDGTESFYGSMNEVYEKVKDIGFIYIHKSYIINTLYIRTYLYEKVILLNDKELPISQARRTSIRDKLLSSNKKGI
ncbi:MAG: response regulator transcription factor [Tissierella sp.]|nr:response regulator transcription factor [Tissierella sp.]